ncbi:MAG TPA: AAA family ATPase, partial [Rubrivivax sp.]|nr:AAA family ATPase [Rubrivivax sp.]
MAATATPLLERQDQLALLQQRIDALAAGPGSGCCVLLEGEPGIGKTSLLKAAAATTAAAARWWWA